MALVQHPTLLAEPCQRLPGEDGPQRSQIRKLHGLNIDIPLEPAMKIDLQARYLVSSPYEDHANQLDLHDLEINFRLFAFALSIARPVRADYAKAPYLDAFNWPEVLDLLRALCKRAHFQWTSTTFYVVIFRSQLKMTIDRDRLAILDQKSHQEACASGGLLKYWFGTPDSERRNLATCLWRSHEDAVAGGAGPWHKQARLAAREMYHKIDFHVHSLTINEDFKVQLEAYR